MIMTVKFESARKGSLNVDTLYKRHKATEMTIDNQVLGKGL